MSILNFELAAQDTISYLTQLGHSHIGFLNQSHSVVDAGYGPAIRTQLSYEHVMQTAGLPWVTEHCQTTPAAGCEAFKNLIAKDPDLTALITINDRAVPGVVQAITDQGWRIPDDFSLVVIGSSASVAELMTPPVTTVEPKNAEMGRLGVELLIQQLEGQPSTIPQVLLPCRLIVRSSSGPCRRNSGE